MNEILNSERVEQFQTVLKLRETEDLLAMWRANDQQEWTPEAFEAMRLILRERLHEEPARLEKTDADDIYICSACGAEVALTDKVCPVCGANVEEVEDEPESEAVGHTLTDLEITFFGMATDLPTEYADYFAIGVGEKIVIPAQVMRIGPLVVRFLPKGIQVVVGGHTDLLFGQGAEAMRFIKDILTDKVAFLFEQEAVEIRDLGAISELEWLEKNIYVWSGLARPWPTDEDGREGDADVEDIAETEDEPEPTPEDSEGGFTEWDLAFLSEATRLPVEYAEYFEISAGDEISIPAHNSKVGDLEVRLLPGLIQVSISDHTDERFQNAVAAVDFIDDILTEKIAFLIDEDGIQARRLKELTDKEKADWTSQVWSGPLRN